MIWLWHDATALVGLLILMGLATVIVGFFAARSHYSKKIPPTLVEPLPKVSLLKPVEDAGPDAYDAFASFCRLEYPGEVEILIGTINRDDPTVAMVGRLQAEFPERDIRLVFAGLQGANRKTSIMETLWHSASGQLLFFSDADVFAPVDYLKQLVPRLAQPDVGCLTCLPRGIRAETIGGKIIALHYGFNYLPQWMLAQQTTGIHWAIGHTMAVPRSVLEKLGGFRNFLDHLADDYELGHRVSQLGLRVIVAPLLLDCAMPEESFAGSFSRMQRWKRTIRRSRGFQYFGVILTCPVFWALLLALMHPLAWWSWAALGLVLAIRWLLAAGLQRIERLPDWPHAWWLLPVVDVMEGVTFFGAFCGNEICWAGRRYSLLKDGTLELRAVEVIQPTFAKN
ncbi:MAG TPA: glycosyltransferase [Verrucomicrobiae bacterium]|nr:glycosyltransferase [Verrucomicrobiae bacterium]